VQNSEQNLKRSYSLVSAKIQSPPSIHESSPKQNKNEYSRMEISEIIQILEQNNSGKNDNKNQSEISDFKGGVAENQSKENENIEIKEEVIKVRSEEKKNKNEKILHSQSKQEKTVEISMDEQEENDKKVSPKHQIIESEISQKHENKENYENSPKKTQNESEKNSVRSLENPIKPRNLAKNTKFEKYKKFISKPKSASKPNVSQSKSFIINPPIYKKRLDISIEDEELIIKGNEEKNVNNDNLKSDTHEKEKNDQDIETILKNSLSMKSREEMENYFHSVKSIRTSDKKNEILSIEEKHKIQENINKSKNSNEIEQYLKNLLYKNDSVRQETPNFGCAKEKHEFSFT